MATQKRAWLYTRIDAPEDTYGGLKGQEKELMDYAEQLGFAVVGGSSDLGSGMNLNSAGLAGVTAAAKEGAFDVLLVKSLPLLGRDSAQVMSLLYALEQQDIAVYSPLEGKISAALLPDALPPGDSAMGGRRHA